MTSNEATAREPQIAAPTTLTDDGVRLRVDAVGWATQPIIDTSALQRGAGRNKRWEYWNVTTPRLILGATVSHIDYACVPEIWVYDRETGRTWGLSEAIIPARGTELAPTLERGPSSVRTKHLTIEINENDENGGRSTRLRGSCEGVAFDLTVPLPEGHERLALVVPWSEKRFQYTVKDVARPVHGTIVLDGHAHSVDAVTSFATLDHGRGRWPYNISWNWGAGSGISQGKRIGIQVGAQWTDGTGVSENAFFVDGIMHKIHGPTTWEYDLASWRTPWRIYGGGLDATFTPSYNKQSRMNFAVLKGSTDQCFGQWIGTFTTETGDIISFDAIDGFAEEVHNRW